MYPCADVVQLADLLFRTICGIIPGTHESFLSFQYHHPPSHPTSNKVETRYMSPLLTAPDYEANSGSLLGDAQTNEECSPDKSETSYIRAHRKQPGEHAKELGICSEATKSVAVIPT